MILTTNNNNIYISFNQTDKYACFGTPIGFYIYSLQPFKKILSRKIDSGVSIVKMLYESNIITFVGKTDNGLYPNNKLIIWDDNKKAVLGEISYNTPIYNINITKTHIIVLLAKKIYIYLFESLYLQKTIDITAHDKKLICMGLEGSDNIIYPGEELGSISIVKLSSDEKHTINAHSSAIENLCISNDGKYCASASERGTIIRMFSLETRECINEFRRGSDPTTIINIRFNSINSILLVSSVKGTIHLYNTQTDPSLQISNTSYDNYGMSYVKWALPQYFHDKWSFTQFNLANISTYTAFDTTSSKLYSFGSDGQFYELNYSDPNDPKIDKTIKYISDENDPFSDRTTTIK